MDLQTTASKVQVDDQRVEELRRIYQEFEEKLMEAQINFNSSEDRIYYIVSTKFLQQWKQFCLSNENERYQPQIMNTELIDPSTKQLRAGLVETQDFELINSQIYKLFNKYKAPQATSQKRIAYEFNGQKKVPIYLDKIRYFLIRQNTLQNIDKKQLKKQDLSFSYLQKISMNNNVADFLSAVKEKENLQKKYTLRGWLNRKQESLQILYSSIAKEVAPLTYWDMKIRGRGKLLSQEKQKLNDLEMEEGDYIIVECAQFQKWFLRSAGESKCEGCFKTKKIVQFCGCQKVGYCSLQCQQKDSQYHARFCNFMEIQELNKKIEMSITSRSAKGLVGLNNLGNTCFMNSCLQCLSHTFPLTEYFLSGNFQEEINRVNPLGTGGKLVKAYATFIKNMWCQQARTYSPSRLKNAVASINPIFSGYSQHDSQEFFSFLVDGLHEDLNRIQKKPYIESVDSRGRPDSIVALESWLHHTQRNQSIVVDLMTGQYKSKVVCPDCKKQSVTFDPFITVTLPIPEQAVSNQLSFFLIANNHERETRKISIFYRKIDPSLWLREATALINRSENQFKFYILTFTENIYDFQRMETSELTYKIESQRKSLFLLQLSPQQQAYKDQLEIVCRFSKKMYADTWDSLWFKRPFWFRKEGTTGITIVKRILKYLYPSTYNHEKKEGGIQDQEKDYEEYQQKMLQNRPFTVNIRYGKIIKRHYHSIETTFEREILVDDDKSIVELCNQLSIFDPNDWQIDIKMKSSSLDTSFRIDRLKKFTEGEKQKRPQKYNEKATVTLDECFEVLEEPEKLEKGNQWYCSDCKEHKRATKQLTIYKAPEIMIIHLKRFKSKGSLRRQKNDTNVLFPQILDLSKYVIDPLPISSYIPQIMKEQKYLRPKHDIDLTSFSDQPKYELYAISNHYGGMGGGHYTAYCKNNGRWYSFNDSSVSATDAHSIKGSGAYMLFYKRIKND